MRRYFRLYVALWQLQRFEVDLPRTDGLVLALFAQLDHLDCISACGGWMPMESAGIEDAGFRLTRVDLVGSQLHLSLARMSTPSLRDNLPSGLTDNSITSNAKTEQISGQRLFGSKQRGWMYMSGG